jgi:signal transduction histidine kinase
MVERMVVAGPIDTDRLLRHIGTIRGQTARLTRLVGSLLDISRIETGRLALVWERVDLGLLTRLAVARERDTLPENSTHKITLHTEESPLVADGDEARLEQVVVNLLSNAVKYSPAGGPIDVNVRHDGDLAILEVVDHGIGVRIDERDILFAPFSRTASAVGAGIEGTGLGLYISHKIVQAHGGSLEYRETSGGGSTFRVTLPLRRAEYSADGSDRFAQPSPRPSDAA